MRFIVLLCLFTVTTVNFTFACECGREGSAGRIFRGQQVQAHKYPWLAHIRSFENRLLGAFAQCGGSLIDDQHILTAAHCVTDDSGSIIPAANIDVYLGRDKAFSDKTKPSRVSQVIIDSYYNRKNLSNDFAILRLSSPVKFTQTIAPICLPNSEDGLSKLKVAGWGIVGPKAKSSNNLLEVDVDYFTRNECNDVKADYILKSNGIPKSMKRYYRIPEVASTHLCAINKKTRGDACSGDSGGPLMHQGSNGRYYLMGIVSGSWTECGEDEDTVGLYTRTLVYRNSIKKIAPNSCWQDLN
ncbi:serine protease 48-like [Tetranychus urticae]|uniref:Peptidase S1 domain-containing protein n=1 Tax=Tetranychus urticae TaxID=32264 RepID=T1JYC0_TETUR|nr:serine protease 48-like [Tetranychus urticae]